MLTIPMKHPASSVDNGVVSGSASVPPPVPARGTPAKVQPAYTKVGRETDFGSTSQVRRSSAIW
jgi:hypothetical protein